MYPLENKIISSLGRIVFCIRNMTLLGYATHVRIQVGFGIEHGLPHEHNKSPTYPIRKGEYRWV